MTDVTTGAAAPEAPPKEYPAGEYAIVEIMGGVPEPLPSASELFARNHAGLLARGPYMLGSLDEIGPPVSAPTVKTPPKSSGKAPAGVSGLFEGSEVIRDQRHGREEKRG